MNFPIQSTQFRSHQRAGVVPEVDGSGTRRADLESLLVYLNDVIVMANTFEQLLERLKLAIGRLREQD